jgi:radical SAM superfamily enzyme YgiQ (UPF0313 family)
MYRSKKYRVKSIDDIKRDLKSVQHESPEKIFLCDGDALGAPMEVLEETLIIIKELFPRVRRVGVYATAQNILDKTEDELKKLSSLGLTIAYLGLESGDDKVLHMVVKGNTAKEMEEASLKIKRCGFKLSSIVMLGVGGKKYTKQHMTNTAKMLEATAPEFFSFLTTFPVPGTPYEKMVTGGLIEPLTSKELLVEMHTIIKESNFRLNKTLFRANHVSNMHPIGGTLPDDKDSILLVLKGWIKDTPGGIYPKVPMQM